ncbi:MAG: GlsB/YeaQ/YmgE family stress response membrane protein [Chitinophagales bacterium]
MMNFILWALFGLVAGIIARFLMPGKDPMGWIMTILLGVAGSFVGGFIGQVIPFLKSTPGSNFFMAIIGAILILIVYRFVSKKM